jgi:hypothetical protein
MDYETTLQEMGWEILPVNGLPSFVNLQTKEGYCHMMWEPDLYYFKVDFSAAAAAKKFELEEKLGCYVSMDVEADLDDAPELSGVLDTKEEWFKLYYVEKEWF